MPTAEDIGALLEYADKNWNKLSGPEQRSLLSEIDRLMAEQGFDPKVGEPYREPLTYEFLTEGLDDFLSNVDKNWNRMTGKEQRNALQTIDEALERRESLFGVPDEEEEEPEAAREPSGVRKARGAAEEALREEATPQADEMAPSVIPEDAQLLWILAGGDERAFLNYVQTYDTEQTRELRRNPQRLQQVVNQLKSEGLPSHVGEEKEGIPRSRYQSSNVYGTEYDPSSETLSVRFHNGGVYEYDVPPVIANAVQEGKGVARTSGQNEQGKWWVGKTDPSLGASVWQFLRETNVPYRKVN